VYGWTKDDRQDNEALDTMIIATGAAIKAGVYSLSDRGWDTYRSRREVRPASAPVPPPVPPASLAPDVIPEDLKAATTPASYWEEHAADEIEKMERVAAENRARFLDPHGERVKGDFWNKEEG
jgi:phage terminase large subunit GpA-like protein